MENISEIIRKIILNEDKKSPLKDAEISIIAGCKRGYVTQIRKKFDIPEASKRLQNTLKDVIKDIVKNNEGIKPGKIAEILQNKGFSATRYLVVNTLKEIENPKNDSVKREFLEPINKFEDPFTKIIGFNGSLENAIKLSKAAILYPPQGLNTLIFGESGVGKNLLAKTMYEFGKAKEIFSDSSQFVNLNCADYADNPQLLLSILFGVKKGAYTGAIEDKSGLIERAHKGVLFLDEIHRMPPKGQEILFQIIDLGKYRRLGESESERKIDTLIIAATTENPEICLLTTFLRRIPMTINLPNISQRPLGERLEIIVTYLREQAAKLGKNIRVSRDASYAFLLYEPSGNIGKIISDLQVCLAKGYLRSLSDESTSIEVTLDMLDKDVQKSLLRTNFMRDSLQKIVSSKGLFISKNEDVDFNFEVNNLKNDVKTIYDFIETRYEELLSTTLNSEEINTIIGNEIEHKIKLGMTRKDNTIDKSTIIKIIGSQLTNVVERALSMYKDEIKNYNSQFFYSVALHVNETIQRIQKGMRIINPKLKEIKNNFKKEFLIAQGIIKFISKEYDIELPEEEAGFIAMYLQSLKDENNENSIGILVITHGNIAQGLVDLVQALMGPANIKAIEMPLVESPENILKQAIKETRSLNQGKGVLLMVDMGSLTTFGPIINEITGIPVKTIKRVEIILLLEAIRISGRTDISLDELYNMIIDVTYNIENQERKVKKLGLKPLIITTCVTGIGTSNYIKEMLDRTLKDIDIEIKALGVLTKESLNDNIEKLKHKYNIICIVGTINPNLRNIPFISMNEVINGNIQDRIYKLYNANILNRNLNFDDDLLFHKNSMSSKEEIIEFLCNEMYKKGYVTSKYIQDVWEREKIGLTCMTDITDEGVAIIHTATSKEVRKNGIALLKLEEPVIWDLIEVDIIFVLSLSTLSKDFPELFNKQIFRNKQTMTDLRKCKSKKDLLNLFNKKYKF